MMAKRPGLLWLFFLLSMGGLSAQISPSGVSAPATQDTAKYVHIRNAEKITFDRSDSATNKEIIVGKVIMQQGKTLFYCDSAVKDNITNEVQAFGNIHINDADSVHTYAQYLRYDGNSRIARLAKKVKLTDGKGVLTTEELEYDLNAKMGTYLNGGKVVNQKSVLTSKEGYYYADTREVFFKQDVKLTDPEYTMATDTLLYSIDTETATFMAATTINDGKSTIRTRSGFYDLKNGKASLGNRPVIEDSTQQIIAEKIDYDKASGEGLAEGNVLYRDTAQGVTILAGITNFNSNAKKVMATRKPLMILKQDNDSIFIAADTLLSVMTVNAPPDTTQKKPPAGLDSAALTGATDPRSITDSLSAGIPINPATKDSTGIKITGLVATDSITGTKTLDLAETDSIRLFLAYRHVRIFSDSVQGVCDSLSYSSKDSVFRFFKEPVLWATEAQVTGDTIYMFTKNKKPDQILVFENGFSISRTPESYFNQIRGNRLNGHFVDGNIDYMRAKGNAESVYYLQDKDSAYIGMNYARADAITMYFVQKELKRVAWVNGVEGTTYPFKQIPEDRKQLRNFSWQYDRRPKSRYELFED